MKPLVEKSMQKKLRKLAYQASKKAHAPYSKFQVGASILTKKGNFFTGCNVENASYGGTVCAERVAAWKAVSEGDKFFKMIYVYSKRGFPPCGLCRQILSEFSGPELVVIIGDEKGNEQIFQMKELFPMAFHLNH